jgi:hypothetical protein
MQATIVTVDNLQLQATIVTVDTKSEPGYTILKGKATLSSRVRPPPLPPFLPPSR